MSLHSVPREILEKFDRSKLLEIYFMRIDGRVPREIPEEVKVLYDVELDDIKFFLLGQRPQDSLLQKFFRMTN